MKRVIKIIYHILIYSCALVGLGFIGVYIALKFNWTTVPGDTDVRSGQFTELAQQTESNTAATVQPTLEMTTPTTASTVDDLNQKITEAIAYQSQLQSVKQAKQSLLCQINVLADYAGYDAAGAWATYQATQSETLLRKITFSLEPYLSADYQTAVAGCATPNPDLTETSVTEHIQSKSEGDSVYAWRRAEEWPNLEIAVGKDADLINKVADETGVPARMITAALLVEQLRLYHTQREYYEQYFAPLKILASATKFAWGVMSIKEATAKQIEEHLVDTTSLYYLGSDYEKSLNFSTADTTTERYNRLTSESDHYYSYLYGALYLKQLMTQWKQAGFDINDRPEIITTLFNIGFEHSQPKADPAVGGSTIEINGHDYTFGGLGYEIYYSGELLDKFPLTSPSAN